MGMHSLQGIVVLLLLVFLVLCSTFSACDARGRMHWRDITSSLAKRGGKDKKAGGHHHGRSGSGSKPHPKPKPKPKPSPSPAPAPTPTPTPTPINPPAATFNVLDFGAKGNGVNDDTEAFRAAWAAACKGEASTLVVPAKLTFLLGPISFAGPSCQPNIVFQLDGTIIATTSPKAWGSRLLQWIEFTKLNGITIRGSGIIEGRGSHWWTNSQITNDPMSTKLGRSMPHTKPTALRFYGSNNVRVNGITIQNSPQFHLKFDSCEVVEVSDVTISSPGDTLNTDGIHLQNSRAVSIHHSHLGCGDDCISIQTGCSNVHIHDVSCGPGHGISIGGLGKDHTQAFVSNITVENVVLTNTLTGVRIKTWQGGAGTVQKIQFSNIKVSEVQMPVVIDQYYCDGRHCKNQSSAVALSSISYKSIIGTYTVKPVHLACSDSKPCLGIILTDIELKPLQEHYHMYDPFCWEAYGELHHPITPPIDCLKSGKTMSNGILHN